MWESHLRRDVEVREDVAMTDDASATPPRPILICFDGSDDARGALRAAAALFPGAPAIVLHVSSSFVDWGVGPMLGPFLAIPGVDEAIREQAELIAHSGLELALELGLTARSEVRTTPGAPWRSILDAADEAHVACIVAGSHGLRLRDRLPLGSVARALVTHAAQPVLVTHGGDRAVEAHQQRLLLGYDGSKPADVALDVAMALLPDSDVHVTSVWSRTERWDEAHGTQSALMGPRSDREAALRSAAAQVADLGVQRVAAHGARAVPMVLASADGIGTALVQVAREIESDVIVIGTHGQGLVARTLLGSTAQYVVQHADRPVLVVPPTSER